MRWCDEGIEKWKRELQEATEELERPENEEGNDATSECVCSICIVSDIQSAS